MRLSDDNVEDQPENIEEKSDTDSEKEKLNNIPSSGIYKTPEKIMTSEKNKWKHRLMEAGRTLGCNTPRSKRKLWNRDDFKNFSFSFHGWALSEGFKLDSSIHGKYSQVLTPDHMKGVIEFGGNHGVNLMSGNVNPKILHKRRYLNGAQRKERYAGSQISGFVGPDGFHRYPDFCPFQHCSGLKEWLIINKVTPKSSKVNSPDSMSPSSPSILKKNIKRLKETNRSLQRSLFVETERSNIFMKKADTCNKDAIQNQTTSSEHLNSRPDKKFNCPICGKVFSRPDTVVKHCKSKHPDNDPVPAPKDVSLPCQLCGKLLSSRHLLSHQTLCKHRGLKKGKCDGRSGICSLCGKYQSRLKCHMMRMHGQHKETVRYK